MISCELIYTVAYASPPSQRLLPSSSSRSLDRRPLAESRIGNDLDALLTDLTRSAIRFTISIKKLKLKSEIIKAI